jgi:chromatin assembly factor 1 subunit B
LLYLSLLKFTVYPDLKVTYFQSGVASALSQPILLPLPESGPIGILPYRMVFAAASIDSVALYDTEQDFPIALIEGIHCTQITDLAWSRDGRQLVVSSTDGFCTIVRFENDELGQALGREGPSPPPATPLR